jgi:hypothetical protein
LLPPLSNLKNSAPDGHDGRVFLPPDTGVKTERHDRALREALVFVITNHPAGTVARRKENRGQRLVLGRGGL